MGICDENNVHVRYYNGRSTKLQIYYYRPIAIQFALTSVSLESRVNVDAFFSTNLINTSAFVPYAFATPPNTVDIAMGYL